jgi:transposase-like protein
MKAKRRRHDPEFKARGALEGLNGVTTIQQIAKDYELHPVQVSDWKKTIQEGVAEVFERGSAGRVLDTCPARFFPVQGGVAAPCGGAS